MSTSWKSQQDLKTGKYCLQFETDDKEKYKLLEKLCQELIDANSGSVGWEVSSNSQYTNELVNRQIANQIQLNN